MPIPTAWDAARERPRADSDVDTNTHTDKVAYRKLQKNKNTYRQAQT